MKKRNIIASLLVGAMIGFFGYSVLDNDNAMGNSNQVERIKEVDTETVNNKYIAVKEVYNVPKSRMILQENKVEEKTEVEENTNEKSEDDKKINEANPEDSEYIICVVRKNDIGDSTTYDIVSNTIAKNHYIGLMTLKLDNSLTVDTAQVDDIKQTKKKKSKKKKDKKTDKVDKTTAIADGIDIKNLELGKYYLVTTAKEIEQGPVITIDSIRLADDYEVKNFEKGRLQNSTFTTDFEQLKLLEPKEALEKALTLQYTWSFEQIEIFKAYVEAEKAESKAKKKAWKKAEKEIDLDLGY